jgi:signal transduction histidine kinase
LDISKKLKTSHYHTGFNDAYHFKRDSVRLDADDPLYGVVNDVTPLIIYNKPEEPKLSFLSRFDKQLNGAIIVPCSNSGEVSLILISLHKEEINLNNEINLLILAKLLSESIAQLKDIVNSTHLYDKLAQDYSIIKGINHDIKNPLSGVRNNLQLMGKSTAISRNEIIRIQNCLAACETIKDAVNNFVLVTDPGGQDKRVNDIINMVVRALDYQISENKIMVRVALDASNPVTIESAGLTRVILNIIMNAISALIDVSREIKEIFIRTNYDAVMKSIHIEIADNGPGIPEILKDNIFEPFASTTGSGLGLYLTYNIIKRANGEIKYESSSKGTVFSIILPIKVATL